MLGEHECSAFELGLSREQTRALQQVAHDELAAVGALAHNAQPPRSEGAPQRCNAR
jgi:hypothetical protein